MTILGTPIKIGSKLYFDDEKQGYTVQAFDDRYIIASKPMNALKAYLYTFVDIKEDIRSRCDLIFGLVHDANNPEDAAKNLAELQSGDLHLSRRAQRTLNIVKVKQ